MPSCRVATRAEPALTHAVTGHHRRGGVAAAEQLDRFVRDDTFALSLGPRIGPDVWELPNGEIWGANSKGKEHRIGVFHRGSDGSYRLNEASVRALSAFSTTHIHPAEDGTILVEPGLMALMQEFLSSRRQIAEELGVREVPLGALPVLPGVFESRHEVVAVAKRDLRAGERLDGEGGYCVWGRCEPATTSVRERRIPIGLADQVELVRDVAAGDALTWDDVRAPASDETWALREEMVRAT